jgi:hypothetical protein
MKYANGTEKTSSDYKNVKATLKSHGLYNKLSGYAPFLADSKKYVADTYERVVIDGWELIMFDENAFSIGSNKQTEMYCFFQPSI